MILCCCRLDKPPTLSCHIAFNSCNGKWHHSSTETFGILLLIVATVSGNYSESSSFADVTLLFLNVYQQTQIIIFLSLLLYEREVGYRDCINCKTVASTAKVTNNKYIVLYLEIDLHFLNIALNKTSICLNRVSTCVWWWWCKAIVAFAYRVIQHLVRDSWATSRIFPHTLCPSFLSPHPRNHDDLIC